LTFTRFLATFLHHMTASITILLADDHAVVRAGIRQFLERAAGLSVIAEADDGDTARRLIAQRRPDVAVLDVHMPKATGIEVARWCRAEHPTTGVLILTAYDDAPYVQAARGYTNKAISAQIFISDRTVQGHLAHIYAKLQTNTRTEAVMRAVSLGLIAS